MFKQPEPFSEKKIEKIVKFKKISAEVLTYCSVNIISLLDFGIAPYQ